MRFPWESLTCVISFYISYTYLFILWLNIMSFLWSLVQPLYICYPLYSELLLKTHMYKWMQTLYSFTFEKFVMITISFWSLGGQMLKFSQNSLYKAIFSFQIFNHRFLFKKDKKCYWWKGRKNHCGIATP